MKQILQNLRNGQTYIADLPVPSLKSQHCLIKSTYSLLSSGTERMLIDFGKSNILSKALSQPDKLKAVIDKIKTDGLATTLDAVNIKFDTPLELGYCNVGKIIDSHDTNFNKDDRVISNGPHAEFVRVSKNLISKIPDNVSDQEASFCVIGSIALHGIRLIKPQIGEKVVVIGLGLIGLMAVQILLANGCQVLAADKDVNRCEIAKNYGAEVINISEGDSLIEKSNLFSSGNGVDSVLITANSKDNSIIDISSEIVRKKGKIVLIGVVGLKINRDIFYKKEITFQVSCSYGPGRYDDNYELKGNDYPFSYIRWTENRNFQTILELISLGKINVKPLISKIFKIDDFESAYSLISDSNTLGILFKYDKSSKKDTSSLRTVTNPKIDNETKSTKANCIFLGAGNFSSRTLIKSFKKTQAKLSSIVGSAGVNSYHQGLKHSFQKISTDYKSMLESESDTVVIATRHNLHSSQVIDALKKNKHVYVEKPLAINLEELEKIKQIYKAFANPPKFMVGFNRRFSPQVKKMKELLDKKNAPKSFIITVNAGYIPMAHWTQDKSIGGGRIIGEVCHFIDLLRFLSGSSINNYNAIKIKNSKNFSESDEDKSTINLLFEDGSIGSIHYFSNGGKSYPKERIEVFCDNSILQLSNFLKLKGFNWAGFNSMNLFRQNKGHDNCVESFVNSIINDYSNPIPFDEIIEVSETTIKIAELLNK